VNATDTKKDITVSERTDVKERDSESYCRCEKCVWQYKCVASWDDYNTDRDCLMKI